MVLKEESDWRMCPDFHTLNKLSIKDKFPILFIDDLLDELHRANLFTKLDLHSSYHKICMREVDTPKTSFSTHEGYYEFLVLPFGLYNAPSTCKILMKIILWLSLHIFILVFFDDILIYSNTWAAHLQNFD